MYLQRLGGLGAWWRLGSSAVAPLFLVQYAQLQRGRDPCTDSLVAVDDSDEEALQGVATARVASA